MTRRLAVGVVGAGFGVKVHVPAFRADARFVVAGLASQNPERAAAAAGAAGIARAFPRWEALVDDPAIDVVSIAVPPLSQPEILERAVAAKKHVFAEKPLGGGAAFAARVALRAEREGITHAVDFEFPEIDVFQRARALLAEGRVGRLRHASVSWHIESYAHRHGLRGGWKASRRAGAGVLGLFLSHSFYYLEWLLGRRIVDLQARLTRDPELGSDAADEVVHALLTCEGGLPVVVAASSCSRAGNGHRIELHGDEGALVLENVHSDYISGFELSELDGPGRIRERTASSWQPAPGADGRIAAVGSLVRRFGDAIERGTRCEPGLAEAARVEALLDRAKNDGTA